MRDLPTDSMVVIRQGSHEYEVWKEDIWWDTSEKEYQYTGIYSTLIATFKSEYKAKQYVGITEAPNGQ